MAKTDPINILNPTAASASRDGDDYIRTLAKAVVEILAVDHYVGPASPYSLDAAGQHAKVKFQTYASGTTIASGTLYAYQGKVGCPLSYNDFSGTNCILTSGSALVLDDGILAHGGAIKCSNTAIITASGVIAVLADGALLASDAAPLSGSAAIANTKYVDDLVDGTRITPAVIGSDGLEGDLTTSIASFSKLITYPNGMKVLKGYKKTDGAYTIDISTASFTGILGVNLTLWTNDNQTGDRGVFIYGLTLTQLTYGISNGVTSYCDGVFYEISGY